MRSLPVSLVGRSMPRRKASSSSSDSSAASKRSSSTGDGSSEAKRRKRSSSTSSQDSSSEHSSAAGGAREALFARLQAAGLLGTEERATQRNSGDASPAKRKQATKKTKRLAKCVDADSGKEEKPKPKATSKTKKKKAKNNSNNSHVPDPTDEADSKKMKGVTKKRKKTKPSKTNGEPSQNGSKPDHEESNMDGRDDATLPVGKFTQESVREPPDAPPVDVQPPEPEAAISDAESMPAAPQPTEEAAEQNAHDDDNAVPDFGVGNLSAAEPLRKIEEEYDKVKAFHVGPRGNKAPPCDLPVWCAAPSSKVVEEYSMFRRTTKGAPTQVFLGQRSWILLGRRPREPMPGPEPDVGLGEARASRVHALVLRNSLGQVFLMDLGSVHGTFLDNMKLPPKKPCAWKIGATAYFADRKTEAFELRCPNQHSRNNVASHTSPVRPDADVPAVTIPVVTNPPLKRPLMQFRLGDELKIQPLPPRERTEIEPLYPGDWKVSADGLSEFYQWKVKPPDG